MNRFHRVVMRYLGGYRFRLGRNIIAIQVLSTSMSLKIFRASQHFLLVSANRSSIHLTCCSDHLSNGRLHVLHGNLLHLHALSFLKSARDSSFPLLENLLCEIILGDDVSFGESPCPLNNSPHVLHSLWSRRGYTWRQDSRIAP